MHEIIFYSDKKGYSELLEHIEVLNKKAYTSKNERIILKQIRFYIEVLERTGTRAGEPFVKFIEGDIWELRPGKNRILFFRWYNGKIVLLHHFLKKTNKTPEREIEEAKSEIKDWIERNDHDGKAD